MLHMAWVPVWHQLTWLWGGEGQGGSGGTGYLLVSGPLGDITILTAAVAFYIHRTCHVARCARFGKHPVDGTPYKVCRKHHPALPNTRITAQDVQDAHADPRRS